MSTVHWRSSMTDTPCGSIWSICHTLTWRCSVAGWLSASPRRELFAVGGSVGVRSIYAAVIVITRACLSQQSGTRVDRTWRRRYCCYCCCCCCCSDAEARRHCCLQSLRGLCPALTVGGRLDRRQRHINLQSVPPWLPSRPSQRTAAADWYKW